MKLRQVCNHPALLLPEDDPTRNDVTSAKLDLALELIEEAIAPNTSGLEKPHKVLVFSQFTGMLDLVSKALKEKEIEHLILTGKTQKRGELVESFNTSATQHVFLISTKAGGTGLNLASADTVIVIDPWWNPSVERQAIDRAHRIGQTRTVNVYRLITAGTIEEKIQALQAKKKDLFDAIINETGASLSALTWEDVKNLFSE
jgi:SNF2 family DNA or RNA helicase